MSILHTKTSHPCTGGTPYHVLNAIHNGRLGKPAIPRGKHGRSLLRQRGEKLERAFAHLSETGGLHRVHVRDNLEIAKRMGLQVAAFNLA